MQHARASSDYQAIAHRQYLNAIGDGLGHKGHISLDIRKWDTGEERRVIVIAPKLPHHKQGLAEVVLAVCKQHEPMKHDPLVKFQEREKESSVQMNRLLGPFSDLQSDGFMSWSHPI